MGLRGVYKGYKKARLNSPSKKEPVLQPHAPVVLIGRTDGETGKSYNIYTLNSHMNFERLRWFCSSDLL